MSRDVDNIIDKIESGETLLFIMQNGKKFIVEREELNNKHATTLDCSDGAISGFHIHTDILDIFKDAKCYTDINVKISVK